MKCDLIFTKLTNINKKCVIYISLYKPVKVYMRTLLLADIMYCNA